MKDRGWDWMDLPCTEPLTPSTSGQGSARAVWVSRNLLVSGSYSLATHPTRIRPTPSLGLQ
jgi:hypothetical protein